MPGREEEEIKPEAQETEVLVDAPTPIKQVHVSFFQLLSFATPADRLMIAFGTLAAVASGLALPIMTIVFGRIINSFISYIAAPNKQNLDDSVIQGVIYLSLLGAAVTATCYIQMTLWTYAGETQSRTIRQRFFESIIRQDIAWFDTQETGTLVSRLVSDISMIQEGVSDKVALAIQHMTTFFAGFVIAYTKGYKLALVLTAVLPIMGGAGAFLAKMMASGSTKGQDSYAEAGGIAQQIFSSIRTVIAFNGQSRAVEHYSLKLVDAQKAGIRSGTMAGTGIGVLMFVVFCCYSLAFWYGSILVQDGQMNGGDVLNVFFAIIIGAFSLGNAAPNITSIGVARGAAVKVFEIINLKSEIDPLSEEGIKPNQIKGNIEFISINFSYSQRPDLQILFDFSLKIDAGQTVALVGMSGSGKSTIVKLLERFYNPSSGTVCLDGVEIKSLNTQWLRRQIGIVSQEPILFDTTIRENILYGSFTELTPAQQETVIIEACKLANAWDFVQKLPRGLDTTVGEAGSMFSGGQKQRIAIARAIIGNPRILLLDEATSALDTESERIVQTALDAASKGRTTIVIAHRLSTIRNADMILVMDAGRIIESGTHAELVAIQGPYSRLVAAQELKKEVSATHKLSEIVPESALLEIKSEKKVDDQTLTSKQLLVEKITQPKKKSVGITRILSYNAPEWYLFIFGSIGACINGLIFPIFSLVFAQILAVFALTGESLRTGANFWSLMFLCLAIAAFIANFSQVVCFRVAGERLTTRLREKCFSAIVHQNVEFFDCDEHASGILVSRLSDDATQIQGLTGQLLGAIIQNFATIVAGLAIAFSFGWQLTLVTLCVMPAIAFGGFMQFQALKGFGGMSKTDLD